MPSLAPLPTGAPDATSFDDSTALTAAAPARDASLASTAVTRRPRRRGGLAALAALAVAVAAGSWAWFREGPRPAAAPVEVGPVAPRPGTKEAALSEVARAAEAEAAAFKARRLAALERARGFLAAGEPERAADIARAALADDAADADAAAILDQVRSLRPAVSAAPPDSGVAATPRAEVGERARAKPARPNARPKGAAAPAFDADSLLPPKSDSLLPPGQRE